MDSQNVSAELNNTTDYTDVQVSLNGNWFDAAWDQSRDELKQGVVYHHCRIKYSPMAVESGVVDLELTVPATRDRFRDGSLTTVEKVGNCAYLVGMSIPSLLTWLGTMGPIMFSRSSQVRNKVQEEIAQQPDKTHILINGAGFAVSYYFGFLDYLETSDLKTEDCRFFAISAGNFAVLSHFLFTDQERKDMFNQAMKGAFASTGFGLLGSLEWLRNFLAEVAPPDAHIRMRDKHVVVIGKWPGDICMMSNFETLDEYLDAIVCSCAMPGFTWRPLFIDGKCLYDYGPQGQMHFIEDLFDVSVRYKRGPSEFFQSKERLSKTVVASMDKTPSGFVPLSDEQNAQLYAGGLADAKTFFTSERFKRN